MPWVIVGRISAALRIKIGELCADNNSFIFLPKLQINWQKVVI